MKISETITREILRMLEEQGGIVEIRRNDFALRLGCVPSQINYVLTSRFTPEQGYVVESRRGGGGYIKITRVCSDKKGQVLHMIDALGDELDFYSARSMLIDLCYQEYLNQKAAGILLAAMSDRALKQVDSHQRDRVRADIFRNALLMAV